MTRLLLLCFLATLTHLSVKSQTHNTAVAHAWADSVFNTLSDDQRITQLMVLRESEFKPNGYVIHDSAIREAVKNYNIGGIVLFQGNPVEQAKLINEFQGLAKTPLMVCIDAENGLGMRMDSVMPLNRQMMLGAVEDPNIIYHYGRLVGNQCKRMGIQVDYAPVVDINNNPQNPVINDRSFGEDKYKVAKYGVAYMKGLQDVGVLACAKHFPGHGDVAVDSHHDLPVINKTVAQLDSLELYPFEKMFQSGAGSVMIAHLYIPAIDSTANTATSLSKKNVTGLLRNQLNYQGLTFTDALDMQGVAKYFPGGEIAAQSLIAGNDMLCLPADVPNSLARIKGAITAGKLSWNDIYDKCRKVLMYKYLYGSATAKPVNTVHLTTDLNKGVSDMRRIVAENALTVLNKTDIKFFPLKKSPGKTDIVYLGLGISEDNTFSKILKDSLNADAFFFDYTEDGSRVLSTAALIKEKYKSVVVGVHNYKRYPANNFGISDYAFQLLDSVLKNNEAVVYDFGNPYALANFCEAKNLVACYEDDSITQKVAANLLLGKIRGRGKLPVTVCEAFQYGSGIPTTNNLFATTEPESVGLNDTTLSTIDSIAYDGIAAGAMPGCVVLVAKDGKIAYEKSYGTYNFDGLEPVSTQSVFDMASVTKICATNISVMKLYDEGKLSLDKTLGDYLPWVRGTNKARLKIRNILLHQAGLVAYIPFYRETIDPATKTLIPDLYASVQSDSFDIRVAENLYLRNDYRDTIYKRILTSRVGPQNKYIYSDNDFIFLGKIVEAVSGLPLNQYAKKTFYDPMHLPATTFLPRDSIELQLIAPTENDMEFRMQHLRGDVHDPGAAMFGGVSGHAGLFSDAQGIAAIMQMLMNGGTFKGHRYIKESTVKLFTGYHSSISRRGYGFDKPEKDNATRKEAYPALSVSPLTFGHTGFTGTCAWADPKYNIVFVFLSNRVNSNGGDSSKLLRMNIRGKIQETIYDAMKH